MAHRTLLNNGVIYEIEGGKCLVGGTGYNVKKGRALVGGTGYDIQLGRSCIFRIYDTNGTASFLDKQFRITIDGVTIANTTGDTEVKAGATLSIAPNDGKTKMRVQTYDSNGDFVGSTTQSTTPYTLTITGNMSVALFTTQATSASYSVARIYPYLKDIM